MDWFGINVFLSTFTIVSLYCFVLHQMYWLKRTMYGLITCLMVVFISNKKIFNFILGKIILVLSAVKLVLHQSMILKMIMRKIMIWVSMSLTDQDQDLEEADSTITVRSMWRAMDFQGKIKLFFFLNMFH